MGFLKILNNFVSRSGSVKPEADNLPDENKVLAVTETLYSKTIAVMNDLPQLQQADFDFALLKPSCFVLSRSISPNKRHSRQTTHPL